MPSDAEWAEAQQRIADLEDRLRRMAGTPLGRALLDGGTRIPFGTTFTSPDGRRYVLRRAAGGNASFVAAPADRTDWSDA